MKFLNLILLMTFWLASFAQAYDGSGYKGFTVCSNSSNDYVVINHRTGLVSFHDPEIYNKYTILGTDAYGEDEGRSNEAMVEYYVFNENNDIVFNVVTLKNQSKIARLETGGKRSKVLKAFAGCVWKSNL